jgi:hypothetical protein
MTYRIFNNAGPKDTIYQYSSLDDDARDAVSEAHDSIWNHVTRRRPPYALAGLLVGQGVIFDDPSPGHDYAGSLDGTWIWSSPLAYFRFRIIFTKSKLDTWEYGPGSRPKGVNLNMIAPSGRLTDARGQDGSTP